MPLETTLPPVAERVADLNARFRNHAAADVLRHAIEDPLIGPVAMVSSFGAESIVLLHMLSVIDRTLPVLFGDTGKLFPETLTYQKEVSARLGLADVRVLRPDPEQILLRDPDGILHLADPDGCCALRKTEPMQQALKSFDAWITGRKRYHAGRRINLELFESDGARIKINPLTFWSPGMIRDYIDNNRLPRHPLMTAQMPSLGCAPCTSTIARGESPRAGRWRGTGKTECGLHYVNGKPTRIGA